MANKLSLIDASRTDWVTTLKDGQEYPGDENVKIGCLIRIANATELMAKNYAFLQSELDKYKRWYERERKDNATLLKSNAGLRGHINRLKKKK